MGKTTRNMIPLMGKIDSTYKKYFGKEKKNNKFRKT